jgi:hypothetical protein
MTRELKEICRQEAPILVKELIRLAYLADQGTDLRTMQDYLGHRDPSIPRTPPALPGIGSRGYGDEQVSLLSRGPCSICIR